MRDFLKKIKPFVLNKYFIVLASFALYIIFFDSNSLLERRRAQKEISDLQKEIKFYKDKIETDKEQIDALNSSLESLETFAREEYLMKNANEEIFIINE